MSGMGSIGARPFKQWSRMAIMRPHLKPPAKPIKQWRIVKGDTVILRTGRDAGKVGKVLRVLRDSNRVLVEGAGFVKKAVRPTESTPGGVISVPAPIHVSRVALVDPSSPSAPRPAKITFRFDEAGRRVRLTRKTGVVVPYPKEATTGRSKPRAVEPGHKDTPAEVVAKRTYTPAPELAPFLARITDSGSSSAEGSASSAGSGAGAGAQSIFRVRRGQERKEQKLALVGVKEHWLPSIQRRIRNRVLERAERKAAAAQLQQTARQMLARALKVDLAAAEAEQVQVQGGEAATSAAASAELR